MNDKLEIAKLATQLTVAIMESKTGQSMHITRSQKIKAADKDTPDVLLIFDAMYEHIQSRLNAQ